MKVKVLVSLLYATLAPKRFALICISPPSATNEFAAITAVELIVVWGDESDAGIPRLLVPSASDAP